MLLMVFAGVHVAVALGAGAVGGIYMMQGDMGVVSNFIAQTAYEALRDYVFAVIPLFMLMGDFLAKCGAARDLFALTNRLMRRLPGRLAIATVLANAVFAFVTGVSIAAAAAFSRIAYPEMKRYGYERKFSLGCIAGSACLGMLIPPSVLMIVWGVLTEQAIGKIFIAGILPGLLLVSFYCAYILGVSFLQPERVGAGKRPAGAAPEIEMTAAEFREVLISTLMVLLLVAATLGGIWLGFFTPTEGAGVGAALALLLAMWKGLRTKELFEVVLSVGRTSAPLLVLLFCAQLYSRVLSMTGVTGAAKDFFIASGLGPYEVLAIMVAIWFVLADRFDLDHPAHRAGIRAGGDGAGLRSARVRDPRHPRDRDRPADAAVRHPGVHGEGCRAAGRHGGRDLPRLDPILDRIARGDRRHRGFPGDRDVAAGGRNHHRHQELSRRAIRG
jgi:C4-dicarboxylate transporter DctM subunit